MSTITADVDVDVPVRTAYEQWTQFESFPHYLSAVEDVTQIDDTLTHWVVNVGGARREFDARIVDQVPDDHISWRSVDEAHAGRVSFRPTDAGAHVELSMEWEPTGFVEKAGAALQLDGMAVKRDLLRFKEFIEERRTPTGAWRGEVHGGVTHPEAQGPAIPGAGATTPGAGGTPLGTEQTSHGAGGTTLGPDETTRAGGGTGTDETSTGAGGTTLGPDEPTVRRDTVRGDDPDLSV